MRCLPLLMVLSLVGPVAAEEQPATRWEKTIAGFEAWDRKNASPANGVLFVGSSSIVRWETRVAFPDLPVINRGFGGSYLSDVNHYYDRVVTPYKPQIIVLYEGDNDVAAGMTPERIAREFETFVARTRRELPDTHVIVLPIKPSLARWEMWPTMEQANELLSARCGKDTHLHYVDTATPLLGPDGKPRSAYLHEDRLHLSPAGYAVWNEIVAPKIRALRAAERVGT